MACAIVRFTTREYKPLECGYCRHKSSGTLDWPQASTELTFEAAAMGARERLSWQ
jgi:hypothetical protein